MSDKMRWRIARQFNRLPSMCWADLVSWALKSSYPEYRWPWQQKQTASCRADLSRTGTCYCGKVRASVSPVQETQQ